MKLTPYIYQETELRDALDAFNELLKAEFELSESNHIAPFFRKRPQLAAFLSYAVSGAVPRGYKFELEIVGKCRADLVIETVRNEFVFIEFEDARPNSIFRPVKGRQEWAPRLEHGVSQIMDWYWYCFGHDSSIELLNFFGTKSPKIHGLLLIGRDAFLDKIGRERLNYRKNSFHHGSSQISIMTYDELYQVLKHTYDSFSPVSTSPA